MAKLIYDVERTIGTMSNEDALETECEDAPRGVIRDDEGRLVRIEEIELPTSESDVCDDRDAA